MTTKTPEKIWQLQYTNCSINRTELNQKRLATKKPKLLHKHECKNPNKDLATIVQKLLRKLNELMPINSCQLHYTNCSINLTELTQKLFGIRNYKPQNAP